MTIKKVNKFIMVFVVFALVFGASSCFNSNESEGEHENESSTEHKSETIKEDGVKSHAEEGEEDGTQFGIDETYEGLRNGVHMTLAYDAETDAFVGMVTNTTEDVISQVRVEVHLSNSIELGPTPRADLAVGESRKIILSADGNSFKSWSTHAESGTEEGHGEGGEHGGEGEGEEGHGKEGRGEHR